jgi:hypothetical protein
MLAGPILRYEKQKDRLRTAAWRNEQDQLRRPEAAVIAMARLKALCTIESVEQVDEKTAGILTKALHDPEARGFSLAETKAVMRRLRKRWRHESRSSSRCPSAQRA